jgi:Fur family transcriptional regulator, ferric uptake regulator
MSNVESLKGILKSAGYSVTKARLAVFSALVGEEPLSMSELAGKTREIDRASVYRTVEVFENLGIVQRLNTGWKYKLELTDKFAEHHHHLTCTKCGRTTDIGEEELEQTIDRLAGAHDFAPTSHQIEIQGTCGECRANYRIAKSS